MFVAICFAGMWANVGFLGSKFVGGIYTVCTPDDNKQIVVVVVVVVAHTYPPVTGQRQTLTYWTIGTLFVAVTTS